MEVCDGCGESDVSPNVDIQICRTVLLDSGADVRCALKSSQQPEDSVGQPLANHRSPDSESSSSIGSCSNEQSFQHSVESCGSDAIASENALRGDANGTDNGAVQDQERGSARTDPGETVISDRVVEYDNQTRTSGQSPGVLESFSEEAPGEGQTSTPTTSAVTDWCWSQTEVKVNQSCDWADFSFSGDGESPFDIGSDHDTAVINGKVSEERDVSIATVNSREAPGADHQTHPSVAVPVSSTGTVDDDVTPASCSVGDGQPVVVDDSDWDDFGGFAECAPQLSPSNIATAADVADGCQLAETTGVSADDDVQRSDMASSDDVTEDVYRVLDDFNCKGCLQFESLAQTTVNSLFVQVEDTEQTASTSASAVLGAGMAAATATVAPSTSLAGTPAGSDSELSTAYSPSDQRALTAMTQRLLSGSVWHHLSATDQTKSSTSNIGTVVRWSTSHSLALLLRAIGCTEAGLSAKDLDALSGDRPLSTISSSSDFSFGSDMSLFSAQKSRGSQPLIPQTVPLSPQVLHRSKDSISAPLEIGANRVEATRVSNISSRTPTPSTVSTAYHSESRPHSHSNNNNDVINPSSVGIMPSVVLPNKAIPTGSVSLSASTVTSPVSVADSNQPTTAVLSPLYSSASLSSQAAGCAANVAQSKATSAGMVGVSNYDDTGWRSGTTTTATSTWPDSKDWCSFFDSHLKTESTSSTTKRVPTDSFLSELERELLSAPSISSTSASLVSSAPRPSQPDRYQQLLAQVARSSSTSSGAPVPTIQSRAPPVRPPVRDPLASLDILHFSFPNR